MGDSQKTEKPEGMEPRAGEIPGTWGSDAGEHPPKDVERPGGNLCGTVQGVPRARPPKTWGCAEGSPEERGRPESEAEGREERVPGPPRAGSEGGAARSARAETKRQRGRERRGGRSGDAGRGAAGGQQDGSVGAAGGRTDGRTDGSGGGGEEGGGRAGRGRCPSPRGAAAAPGGAGRAPGVRAEEAAAATTWTRQTDGVTDGLAAAAASGGHSPSSLTRPGPRLRFCTPEGRGLRVKAPRPPRPAPPPASAARASPGTPGPVGDARSRLGTWPGARAVGSTRRRASHSLSPTPRTAS